MEQTGRYLQGRFYSWLQKLGATIVLTGANDDISVEHTDAWDNLALALESADNDDIEPDVYLAFHDRLIPAHKVVKEPFNGLEMNYVSHDSEAYFRAQQRQRQRAQAAIARLTAQYGEPAFTDNVIDYPVNVILQDHRKLMTRVRAQNPGAVLLTLYHSSTANTEKPELSVAELARTITSEYGTPFFAVTENGEPCRLDRYETSVKLADAGIIPLGDMLHDVAFAKLSMLIGRVGTQGLHEAMLA